MLSSVNDFAFSIVYTCCRLFVVISILTDFLCSTFYTEPHKLSIAFATLMGFSFATFIVSFVLVMKILRVDSGIISMYSAEFKSTLDGETVLDLFDCGIILLEYVVRQEFDCHRRLFH